MAGRLALLRHHRRPNGLGSGSLERFGRADLSPCLFLCQPGSASPTPARGSNGCRTRLCKTEPATPAEQTAAASWRNRRATSPNP